jgi:hypothetical protein
MGRLLELKAVSFLDGDTYEVARWQLLASVAHCRPFDLAESPETTEVTLNPSLLTLNQRRSLFYLNPNHVPETDPFIVT